jgi:U3 small nucleolar RNA-associated protein 11
MSAFRKISKSRQKNHKERSQPAAREHLGLLEKKKDYKQRADEHHKRQNTLKALRRKALNKNPDEFYFKMVRTKLEDGVHQTEDGIPAYTPEQLKLIQSQDIQYVNFKRSVELKKIERLKANLHLLDVPGKPKNQHVVFLDTKQQVREFDAAKYLQTDAALLDRTYNRPRLETLSVEHVKGNVSDAALAECAAEKSRLYAQLTKRIERERQLHIVTQKMETKKQLLDKKSKKKKVRDETVDSAAVFRWVSQRKR